MIWFYFSVLLFGLIYPGGQYFINQGMSTFSFALGYLFFRCLFQLLISIFRKGQKRYHFKVKHYLIMGMVGASLNFLEFKGLEKGLDIAVNSFIIFCHPVSGILLRRIIFNRSISKNDLFKLCMAIIGVGFIILQDLNSFTFDLNLIYPVLAGIMFSLWIISADYFTDKKGDAFSFSLQYDLATMILLFVVGRFIFGPMALSDFEVIYRSSSNMVLFPLFSLFIGVFPNLFFYLGVERADSLKGQFISLFEPIVASIFAYLMYSQKPSSMTYLGAIFIMLANVELSFIRMFLLRQKQKLDFKESSI